jgi:hypothetical protein
MGKSEFPQSIPGARDPDKRTGHSWNPGKLAATLWEVKKAAHADR